MSSKYSVGSINTRKSTKPTTLMDTNVVSKRKRHGKNKKNLSILDQAYSIIEETAARESFSALTKQADDFILHSTTSSSNQVTNDPPDKKKKIKKNKKKTKDTTTNATTDTLDKTVFDYEEALRRRDFQKVLWMIENGDMPIDYEAINGENALLASIDGKNPLAFEILLKKKHPKAHINSCNRKGYTPLIKAIASALPPAPKKPKHDEFYIEEEEHLETTKQRTYNNTMVRLVLEGGADLCQVDAQGKSPMDWAMLTKNQEAIRLLNEEQTRRLAKFHQSQNLTQRLNECHALLTKHEMYVASMETLLLQHTLVSFDLTTFQAFISKVDIDLDTFSKAVMDLLEAKAFHLLPEPFPPLFDKKKALVQIHHQRQKRQGKQLERQANAKLAVLTDDQLTIEEDEQELEEARLAWLAHCFYLNRENKNGWTPLTRASANGDIELTRFLVDLGADIHQESTKMHHTPMTWACYCGHEAICLYLLRCEVDLEQQTKKGKTALIHAVSNGQSKILHHLLNALHYLAFPTRPKDSFNRLPSRNGRAKSARNTRSAKRSRASSTPQLQVLTPTSNQSSSQNININRRHVLEWHDRFLEMLLVRDNQGKHAMDYANELYTPPPSPPPPLSAVKGDEGAEKEEDTKTVESAKVDNPVVVQTQGEQELSIPEPDYEIVGPCEQEKVDTCRTTAKLSCNEIVWNQLTRAMSKAKQHEEYVKLHLTRTQMVKCRFTPCLFQAPKDLIVKHETHECLERNVTCEKCDQEDILFKQLTHHMQFLCPKRPMVCTNVEFGCKELLPFDKKKLHEQEHCRKRLVHCRLRCQENGDGHQKMSLRFDQRQEHESFHCPLRPIECPPCGKNMQANELVKHQKHSCVKRLVQCTDPTHGGCGLDVPFDQLVFHQSQLCVKRKLPCKWQHFGCEQWIGGDGAAKHHHEQQECPFRLVYCKNTKCPFSADSSPSPNLLYCFQEQHYSWQCLYESKKCPLENNGHDEHLFLPTHLLYSHVLTDAGDCCERPTHCRLDLCGKEIKLYDPRGSSDQDQEVDTSGSLLLQTCDLSISRLEKRGLNLVAMRQHVSKYQVFLQSQPLTYPEKTWTFLTQLLTQELNKWTQELTQVEKFKEETARYGRILNFRQEDNHHLIEFNNNNHDKKKSTAEWILLKGKEFELIGVINKSSSNNNSNNNNHTCGQLIVSNQLVDHEFNHCKLRLIPCPLECGQRLTADQIQSHLLKRCNLRNSFCRLGCGQEMQYLMLLEHEDTKCPLRQVFCEFCHEQMVANELTQHVEKKCLKFPRRCRFGCGQKMALTEFEQHELTQCPKRLVSCQQCERKIWISEMSVHLQQECPFRLFGPCPLACGQEQLKHNETLYHTTQECVKRMVTCGQCHEKFHQCDLETHKRLMCPQRHVYCRKGCGLLLKEINTNEHEDIECTKRIVACPQKCGLELGLFQMDEHVQLTCAMRVLTCPNGCGDSLFAYQYTTHWKRCRQRLFECGAGSKKCARPIRAWICQVKNKNNKKVSYRLVKCRKHQENALLWAIKTQDEDLINYFLQHVAISSSSTKRPSSTNVDGKEQEEEEQEEEEEEEEENVDVNEEFANGFTPLAFACSLGNVDICKTLLRFGANVNLESSRGRTPLMEAIQAQSVEIVQLLIENRANIVFTNRHGINVMSLAKSLASSAIALQSTTTHFKKTILPSQMSVQEKIVHFLEDRQEMEAMQRALFTAISLSDYETVSNYLKNSTGNKYHPDQLTNLQKEFESNQSVHLDLESELQDAIKLRDESIADTEAKHARVVKLLDEVDHCKSQLSKILVQVDELTQNSNVLEVDMLQRIREITAHDLAMLLNNDEPSEKYQVIMKAICLLSGVLPRGRRNANEYTPIEWWKTAQALLMDRSLLTRLRSYRKHLITSEVMAKVRRECMKHAAYVGTLNTTTTTTTTNGRDQHIVGILANWVKGVDTEYHYHSERHMLTEKRKKMAVKLDTCHIDLDKATFEMQVATRSLPARQEEVDVLKRKVDISKRELDIAKQRLKVYRQLNFVSLTGHTPLTFACAIGNEAMVNILITNGANCGFADEEKNLCANYIQLISKQFIQRRRLKRASSTSTSTSSTTSGSQVNNSNTSTTSMIKSKSDEAVLALVQNIAHSLLLKNFERKIRFYRHTHRVPIHEAVMNGYAEIAAILLENNAKLWQVTHVVPQRLFPNALIHFKRPNSKYLFRRGGWLIETLTPCSKRSKSRNPWLIQETLHWAKQNFDCKKFLQKKGYSSVPIVSILTSIDHFLQQFIIKFEKEQALKRQEVRSKKQVVRKTFELQQLHRQVEKALHQNDFLSVAQFIEKGAYADCETSSKEKLTPLMVACMDEQLYIQNADGQNVLVVEFLLDKTDKYRPQVDFENANGWTSMMMCAFKNSLKCAQVLIERGANVNYASIKTGQTPLMLAASNNHGDFVQLLLAQPSIDVFKKDFQGKNAFDYAKEKKFDHVMKLLSAAMGGHKHQVLVSYVNALYGVCKWGCGFMVETHGYDVSIKAQVLKEIHPLEEHELNQCPKRIIKCPNACEPEDPLWMENLQEHLESTCPNRLVKCGHSEKCLDKIKSCELKDHLANTCDYRNITCECGEQMTSQKWSTLHTKTQCRMRLVACNFCSIEFRVMDLKEHQRNECPNRKVRCRFGCSSIDQLLSHEREVHELQLCPLRRIQCKWKCEENVIANDQQEHEMNECLLRLEKCPNKCPQLVVYQQMDVHLKKECTKRPVTCSFGCGRKVPLHLMEIHQKNECIKRQVQCTKCQKTIIEEELTNHLTSLCLERISVCGLCGLSNIPYPQLQHHRQEECKMRPVKCQHKLCMVPKVLLAHEKEHHEQFECQYRNMWCPMGCGEIIVAHTVKQHEKHCKMRFVTCSNECGFECREKDRIEHEMNCNLLPLLKNNSINNIR